MKMKANDFQTQRQLKVQIFHQLAEQHAGLVIASQLAAPCSRAGEPKRQPPLKPNPQAFKQSQQ
jgi:hypothetical protein